MERVSIQKVFECPEKYMNTQICLGAWIKSICVLKNILFMELNDGSVLKGIQAVCESSQACYEDVKKYKRGMSVIVKGIFSESAGGTEQWELIISEICVEGPVRSGSGDNKKGMSLDALRKEPHLRVRTKLFYSVFKIRSLLTMATHLFFQERGFINVTTPIITSSSFEGAGDIFAVNKNNSKNQYFEKKAYLTVSGQLYDEALMYGFGKVYSFGPTFRANSSNTIRHLSEFWMIEPEMAFDELEEGIELAKEFIRFMSQYVLDNAMDELLFLDEKFGGGLLDQIKVCEKEKCRTITYTQAIDLLIESKRDFEFEPIWGNDLSKEHLKYLVDILYQCPVIITDYPCADRPFYMKKNEDGQTVRNFYLYMPRVGQLIGGCENIADHDQVKEILKSRNMTVEEYAFYLDTCKNGAVRHTGLGIGFERVVMYYTGMSNIRDVMPFPRSEGYCPY